MRLAGFLLRWRSHYKPQVRPVVPKVGGRPTASLLHNPGDRWLHYVSISGQVPGGVARKPAIPRGPSPAQVRLVARYDTREGYRRSSRLLTMENVVYTTFLSRRRD